MSVQAPKKTDRDLFDDTTMTFGEHLEVLRVHLIKAIAGLVVAMFVALLFGDVIIRAINEPLTAALHRYGVERVEGREEIEEFNFTQWIKVLFGLAEPPPQPESASPLAPDEIVVQVNASQLLAALHRSDPETFAEMTPAEDEQMIPLTLRSPMFVEWRAASDRTLKPITLNVQEGFMTYLKVSLITGFVIAGPWIFYQIWLFIAAGLYPHERKYVHFYLPASLGLFLLGAVFCYFVVLPFIMNFLLGFNRELDISPQIRLSEGINFVLLIPAMFGVSFQLPLVMLLLERLQIIDVKTYREKRRIAILVNAIIAMLLMPGDPFSMLAMLIPLILLYEFGIWICSLRPMNTRPFETA